MGTSGRYALACEALACFLAQTVHDTEHVELVILNQHPIPLHFEHPRVRVVNERPPGSLRYIRQRMHELADPGAELIHWWDDDDLYLPWHLEDGLRHIQDSVAWKPRRSWFCRRFVDFEWAESTFEGSWLFRADYLKAAPVDTHETYTDHPVIWQTMDAGRLSTTELGGETSYVYRWDTGSEHLSGRGQGDEVQQQFNVAAWRRRSRDVREDGVMVPADLTLRGRQYLDGTRHLVTPEEHRQNEARLSPWGLGPQTPG
jgi:hypothetical protein